jgi:sulfotransferase family protein
VSPARGPILVTGAHRSGTTWVGKMLALAPGTGYVHEPFSPLTAPGISSAPFGRFFTYVTPENAARYEPGLQRTLAFDYSVGRQLRAVRTPRDACHSAQDLAAFARARRARARPVVKDPIALFSAEWLAERFGMDVVVTVRHPAGFAASLLRLGWTHRFEDFLADDRLLRDRLRGFEDEIRTQAARPGDVLDQAILLWRICYRTVDGYRGRHPGWTFVRHEGLSRDPVPGFAGLYERVGLELTEAARRGIERASAPTNPTQARSKHSVRVHSRANLLAWRTSLSPAQIDRVREGTADVWPRFYSDEDW